MGCSPFDLRDHFFGELNASEQREVERHVAACASCRRELSELELVGAAMKAVPDEEPPRRIAFVSDKIFEPRWRQALWNSGPKLGFASAAMLSAAILAHGVIRPAAIPAPAPLLNQAAIEASVQSHVDAAVQKALADVESRYDAKLAQAAIDQRRALAIEYKANLVSMQDYANRLNKRLSLFRRAAYETDGAIQ